MTNKIDIEAIIIALENIIIELETNKFSLEMQLKLFKKGMNLILTCQKLLSNTQQKIKTLLTRDPAHED